MPKKIFEIFLKNRVKTLDSLIYNIVYLSYLERDAAVLNVRDIKQLIIFPLII